AQTVPKVRVSFTGAPAYAIAYAEAAKHDLAVSTGVSFACILMLFGLWGRSLRVLPFVALTLGCAYIVTLGIWVFCVGRISALALAFGGIVLGIGVDVPIQWWCRLREELADHPPAEALARTRQHLVGVSIVATLGPALVFLACAASAFRG